MYRYDAPAEHTPEEAARRLLDIFSGADNDKIRAGQIIFRRRAMVDFLRDRGWHRSDFVAGLRYASEHHWIAIPSPNVIKLTPDGCATRALEK